MRRFPGRYIDSVKPPDRRVLRLNRKMPDAFRTHFRGRFDRCPDLPVQEFRSYLADFPRPREAKAASCEGVVTECEVRDALKQIGLNKSPGLDSLPNKVYLRLLILTDMFNHWFTQGAISDSVTKGVITLLKKGGRHVWEGLGCPLSPLLYVLAFEPLLRRLRDEGANPALHGIPFAGPLTARVSAFTDYITVFVFRHLGIEAVKKTIAEYERIAGAKVNFDKSEAL